MDRIIEGDNLIIVGDFNSMVDFKKDRRRTTFIGEFPTNIRRWLRQHHMVDSWRFSRGEERKYTYYSNRFCSYSRIDYIWISEKIAIRNSYGTIEIKDYSDHAVISIEWEDLKENICFPLWKLQRGLLMNSTVVEGVRLEILIFLKFKLALNRRHHRMGCLQGLY